MEKAETPQQEYPESNAGRSETYYSVDYATLEWAMDGHSTLRSTKLDDTLEELKHGIPYCGKALEEAEKEIRDAVFKHYFDREKLYKPSYPLFCLDEITKEEISPVAVAPKEKELHKDTDHLNTSSGSTRSPKGDHNPLPLPPPREKPTKGTCLKAITACFGSPKLKKRVVNRHGEDENASYDSSDNYSSASDLSDDSWTYYPEGKKYDVDFETLKDGDIYTYFSEERSWTSTPNTSPYLPIIGFILIYSDGVEVEIGSLRGTTSHATLNLAEGEHIDKMAQYFCKSKEADRKRGSDYPVSVRIDTSDERCVYFQQASLRTNYGGNIEKGGHEIPYKESILNDIFMEWDFQHNCIKGFLRKSTRRGTSSSLNVNADSMHQNFLPETVLEAQQFASFKEKEVCKVQDTYCTLLHCISDSAWTALLSWFLAQNSRREKLEELNRLYLAGLKSPLQLGREQQITMAFRSKSEHIEMLTKKQNIIGGIQFHLENLNPKFLCHAKVVEKSILLEEDRLKNTMKSKKGKDGTALCNRGCYKFFYPEITRKGKRCSLPGCFDRSPSCGCNTTSCRRCFVPLCSEHEKSHEQQCAATFTQRCGWKDGIASLRFQDKFCGSILKGSKFQCVSCGVQACRDCGILCLGPQPKGLKSFSLDPLSKSQENSSLACACFCCKPCRGNGYFSKGRCRVCSKTKTIDTNHFCERNNGNGSAGEITPPCTGCKRKLCEDEIHCSHRKKI